MGRQNAERREAALFKSNRSQAVRIPKSLAFPEGIEKVEITRNDDGSLLLRPVRPTKDWAAYFATAPRATDDFMVERLQGEPVERESFD